MDPAGFLPLFNNRLISLDKTPSMHPIGISEVLRRVVCKSILPILKKDIMQAAGATQVCAGQSAGGEATIHTPCQIFEVMGTDDILLVDADNAFNCLNRAVALHNIQYTCPLLSTTIINLYLAPACLFVTGRM